jgi:hypothetical protein
LNGVSLGREVGLLALIFSLPVQFAFASTGGVAHQADGPELVINITKRDFGEVFAGEELEQTFLFRNVGTKPLELSQKSTLSSLPADRRFLVAAAAPVHPGDPVADSWERDRPGRLSTTGTMWPGRPRSQLLVGTVVAARAAPS